MHTHSALRIVAVSEGQRDPVSCRFGRALGTAAPCRKLCAGRESSFSTLHVDPDQRNTMPDPRPNPDPHPNPNANPLASSRSAGAVTRLCRVFLVAFSEKNRWAAERPALNNKTRALHSYWCRMQLRICRVIDLKCLYSRYIVRHAKRET